jgi:transcriptional regulator with GAF, ATPase, and Fis domain
MGMMGSPEQVQRRIPTYSDGHDAPAAGHVPPRRWHSTVGHEPDLRRALADLAARFASSEAGNIDGLIVDSLGEIAAILEADRAFVWRQPAGTDALTTFDWADPSLDATEGLDLAQIRSATTKLRSGFPMWLSGLEEVCDAEDRDALVRQALRAAVIVPIRSADDATGAVAFGGADERFWMAATIEKLQIFAGMIGQALARRDEASKLQAALLELGRLRAIAGDAIERPRRPIHAGSRLLVSESTAVRQALRHVEQVAATPSTVLLLGETGVGKEVFAQAIHGLSTRGQRQMVRVSCGAIPSTLIESELFGHERGAFTGALTRQIGRFEAASHSTLFLDEIGELSAEVQVKLLRVLQERVIERLGSTQAVKIDVRIIAATNRNLEKAVEDHSFREDLFYRLNVFPIVIPPLRERAEDIPMLAWQFVDECARAFHKTIESISKDSMRQLQAYQWPGNVRELRNVIERAVILATGPRLVVQMPEAAVTRHPHQALTLRSMEIEHIRATLESTNWRIRGHGGAAQRLGLKPTTLETRMAKLGVVRPKLN